MRVVKSALIPALFLGATAGLIGCASETVDGAKTQSVIPASHASLVATIEQGRMAMREDDRAARTEAAAQLKAMKARPIGGTDDLVQLWQDADKVMPPMRGRVQGPGYRVADLPAGASDQFQEILYGVETARISVSGAEGLSLDILDEAGKPPLCEAQTVCEIIPAVTARYEIVVKNHGDASTYIVVID